MSEQLKTSEPQPRVFNRATKVLAALLCLVPANAFSENPAVESRSEIVHQFLAAFNAHDSETMGKMVTEDVMWLSVADGVTSIEVEGRSKLVAAMDEYFASCPSCRSTISTLMASRARVSAVEVATWRTDGGLKSQQSLAVYEFSGSLISAVYYFPAESVSPPANGPSPE